MAGQSLQRPKWQMQFFRFASVGAIGTLAHYVLLVMLVEMLRTNEVAASTAGATLGALVNYLLNRRYTFRSKKRHGEALTKFLIIAALGLTLNSLLMLIFVEILNIYYLLAQVLSTGLVLIWNFLGNRFWTFRDAN
jgi:putative flippase GtrA